uniref:Uncharacterized protein n=1 Tax=Anopheles atroparvus TaxID=41427 RepID=A0A182JGQ5_ANOAO
MSLKRLAVISAVGSHNSFNNQTISYVSSYSGGVGEQGGVAGSSGSISNSLRTGGHHQGLHTMRPGANLHGNVNIMLGGAMLSVVVTVVCFVCYCCHRNIKKRSNSLYRQQWLETEANMDIYSVEQCYDPPASSSGGGFFLDSGSSGTGDYQSLPVLTSGAINHSASAHPPFAYHQHHHPYQYHHLLQQQQQQQQHHYAPYPNGPPPSYDTVVAQDELLLAGAGPRRKRHDCADGTALSAGCKSSSCTEALLRKASARARLSQTPRQRPAETSGRSNDHDAGEDDVTEPFWRSIELEEAERQEAQEGAPMTLTHGREEVGNCGCLPVADGGLPSGSQVPPIYCRNCGYHVHEENGSAPINPSTHAMASSSSVSPDWLAAMNNEALLVDYDGSSTTAAGTSSTSSVPVQNRPATNAINRSNAMEGHGSNTTSLNNNDDDAADSDMLTMPTTTTTMAMSTLSSPTTTVHGLDTANNNAGCPTEATSPANEASIHPKPPGNAVPAETRSNGENNNVIIGTNTRQASALIEILIVEQRPQDIPGQLQLDGSSSIRRAASATVEDLTNGNAANGEPQPPIRRPLDANGLVRLDMSQIIDHTGLPTYEAALKLESSGYV